MKRYSIVALIFLVAAMLSYSIGTASAMQIHFKRDPAAVWASCGSSGGYGGYDGEAGVICIHPGCDGNPKHSCIVDCDAGGNCTGTTPLMPLGNRSLIALLTATHPVAQLDDTGTPNHGGANPGSPPLPGRANFVSHLGDTIQIGNGIQ